MNQETLKEAIRRELPALLRSDPDFRNYVIDVSRGVFADREETRDRFWEVLAEIRQQRETQERKWAEQDRKWEAWEIRLAEEREADAKKWEEWKQQWAEKQAEDARKWAENEKRWEKWINQWAEDREANEKRWWESERQWAEKLEADARKSAENEKEFERLHQKTIKLWDRVERRLGAMGARWGMQSERSFRNALAGILESSFGVEVKNIREYDADGTVFGRPDQIELDIIIKNSILLICELKSSMSKSDMVIFERKARFYEARHDRKADRLIVISPMIDPKAQSAADELGIETYSDSEDVESI
jgi:hypothetical protein